MHYIEPRNVLNTAQKLLEELACLLLLDTLVLDDVVKELTSRGVLHDEIELLRSLDYLIQLHNMRMLNNFENMNFTRNSLNVCNINYF